MLDIVCCCVGWAHLRTNSRIFNFKWALFCGFTGIHGLIDWIPQISASSPGPASPCWQLLAKVQINAKGMICLFSIETVAHAHLTSFILWRILMHWYRGGFFFFFFYNLLSNDLLIAASNLTENYRSFLGNQIFTHFLSVYVAQVSREGARGDWLWGAAECESLRCHSYAATGMSGGQTCDSLLPLSR